MNQIQLSPPTECSAVGARTELNWLPISRAWKQGAGQWHSSRRCVPLTVMSVKLRGFLGTQGVVGCRLHSEISTDRSGIDEREYLCCPEAADAVGPIYPVVAIR